MREIAAVTQRILAPTLAELGAELRAARAGAAPVRPLTARVPGLTVDQAYEIQRGVIEAEVASGRRRVGHKVGLTSWARQQHLGVREPDFGTLLDDMICESGTTVSRSRLIAPRLEAEIAVVMQRDLQGPQVTLAATAAAVGYAVAAVEIIDSRIASWDVRLPDTVADNASSGLVVINDVPSTIEPKRLLEEEVVLSRDGEPVATGVGTSLLGDPLRAIRWLANQLGRYGVGLRAGDLVLAGAVHASVPLERGRRYSAVYRSGLTVEFSVD